MEAFVFPLFFCATATLLLFFTSWISFQALVQYFIESLLNYSITAAFRSFITQQKINVLALSAQNFPVASFLIKNTF